MIVDNENSTNNVSSETLTNLKVQFDTETLQIVNCSEIINLDCKDETLSVQDLYCGTDFITYSNNCLFQKAKCRNSELDILYRGIEKFCYFL